MDGRQWELDGMRDLREAKKQLSKDQQGKRFRHFTADRGNRTTVLAEDKIVAQVAFKFITEVQTTLGERMIRRTISSKRPDGSPINASLPPYIEHLWSVDLTPEETAVLQGIVKRMFEEGAKVGTLFDFDFDVSIFIESEILANHSCSRSGVATAL
jgi:SNF2 family DNA or RNA helicase